MTAETKNLRERIMGHHSQMRRRSLPSVPIRLLKVPLTPEILRQLSGVENLMLATVLKVQLDVRRYSIQHLGNLLPNIMELKLSHSVFDSVRDLGTKLCYLQVLWISFCGLTSLDGICSMILLRELYASYNNISDISPCTLLEYLEVMDVEGNTISDMSSLGFLSICPKMKSLTLIGNPISKFEDGEQMTYRKAVHNLVPQLEFLDDVPINYEIPIEEQISQDAIEVINNSIKENHCRNAEENIMAIEENKTAEIAENGSTVVNLRPSSAVDKTETKTENENKTRPHSSLETSCNSSPWFAKNMVCGNLSKSLLKSSKSSLESNDVSFDFSDNKEKNTTSKDLNEVSMGSTQNIDKTLSESDKIEIPLQKSFKTNGFNFLKSLSEDNDGVVLPDDWCPSMSLQKSVSPQSLFLGSNFSWGGSSNYVSHSSTQDFLTDGEDGNITSSSLLEDEETDTGDSNSGSCAFIKNVPKFPKPPETQLLESNSNDNE